MRLNEMGYTPLQSSREQGKKVAGSWAAEWKQLYILLKDHAQGLEVSVISGAEKPSAEAVAYAAKPLDAIHSIAQSLWLGDALREKRLMCYMQPIMGENKTRMFGYESFVRATSEKGDVISGFHIIAAAKILGIEYAIDRYLHIEAINSFMASGLQGYLFINFMPGFIQRPEVYLEGLNEAAGANFMPPKNIVLDFTRIEAAHDIEHMKRVTQYCREKGYSVALDDVTSFTLAQKLVPEILPDFLKLDRQLIHYTRRQSDREQIKALVDLAHAHRAKVIAEGVENSETHQLLLELGVDYFQGYYFGTPEPATVFMQRAAG